ncbi:MAG: ferritin-like domain-containing protein [Acidipropionibacterium sp.]|jgi:hypothetical protein|nr:ferritin-like domain-containing protein [Acidipropionibacterium sp.]
MTFGTPSRRAVLAVGLSLVPLGLTGCYRVSPLVGTEARTSPSPTPQVTAERRAAVSTEASLADLARSAGLAGIAAAHLGHATVLAQADPLAGRNADTTPVIPVPSPSASPGVAKVSAAQLLAAERTAGKDYLRTAGQAADSGMSLLWASLSCFCTTITASGPAPQTGQVYPVTLPAEPAVAARQVLLSRLNDLATGLEWGIGRLPASDPLREDGLERLSEVNLERARLRAELRSASATPTPLLPGYPMPATPSTAASTKTLWSSLELGVLAGWGRVAAATRGAERTAAVTAMSAPLSQALQYGAAMPAWPGWV